MATWQSYRKVLVPLSESFRVSCFSSRLRLVPPRRALCLNDENGCFEAEADTTVTKVNGRAWVIRDADVLRRTAARGRRPPVAIGIEVEECFLHCAKAFRRSGLWRAEDWPDRSELPSLGRMLRDQGAAPGASAEELVGRIEESYQKRLH